MTDDDLLDLLHDRPHTIREIARRSKMTEHRIGRRLRELVKQGLIEEGPRRPQYDGYLGAPHKTWTLAKTKKAAA